MSIGEGPIGFNQRDAEALLRVIDLWRSGALGPQMFGESDIFQEVTQKIVAKTPTTGIPARGGTTLGVESCPVYRIQEVTGGNWELKDAGYSEDIFNISAAAVAGDAWITATREKSSNHYIVDVEDCGS